MCACFGAATVVAQGCASRRVVSPSLDLQRYSGKRFVGTVMVLEYYYVTPTGVEYGCAPTAFTENGALYVYSNSLQLLYWNVRRCRRRQRFCVVCSRALAEFPIPTRKQPALRMDADNKPAVVPWCPGEL